MAVAMLVLTAPALALARTASGASGVMTICTGTGPLRIAVDADGQPVPAPHICPDCALAALGAVMPQAVDIPARMPRAAIVAAPIIACDAASASLPSARARAPPNGFLAATSTS